MPLHTPTGEKAEELTRQDVTRRVDAGSPAVVAVTIDNRQLLDNLRQFLPPEPGLGHPVHREGGGATSPRGGKRVRPALLAARLLGHDGEEEVTYAAVVQPIHTATLIHDAVIDHAALRRGQSTLNDLWGNNLTVLLGDWARPEFEPAGSTLICSQERRSAGAPPATPSAPRLLGRAEPRAPRLRGTPGGLRQIGERLIW